MMRKNGYSTLVALLVLCFSCSAAADTNPDDSLFQYSTINALLDGLYDGDINFADLSEHGDMGLGTFNHLDGEMIGLNGKFYQIKTDGTAYPVADSRNTPFAVVTRFDIDGSSSLPANLDYDGLQETLELLIDNRNHFFAFLIQGRFKSLTVRSVPAQTPPYRPLAEVIKEQVKFDYRNIEGTLIGFYTPDYMSGLNIPGFHFHFLSRDLSRGGHVLGLITDQGLIELDEISEITMQLPESEGFAGLELDRDRKKALDRVEKK